MNKKKAKILYIQKYFFLLLFLFHTALYSIQLPLYDVSENKKSLTNFKIAVFQDTTKKLTIDEITNRLAEFHEESARFNIPLADSNNWLGFTLTNSSTKTITRLVRLDESFIDEVDFYLQNKNSYTLYKNGLMIPLSERTYYHRLPVIEVELAPYETKNIFIRYYSIKHSLIVGLNVETQQHFDKSEKYNLSIVFFFFGAAGAIFIYNLILYITLRDTLYLYYLGYTGSFIIFALAYSGLDIYLYDMPITSHNLYIAISMTAFFLILFVQKMLKTNIIMPKIDVLLSMIAGIFFVQSLLVLVDIKYYDYTVFLGAIFTPIMLWITLYVFYLKHPLRYYFLIGIGAFSIGTFLISALNLGLVEYNFFTRNGYMFGSMIELLVFSLALAYRVKLLEIEKQSYHESIIDAQIQAKRDLEVLVTKRTEELNRLNKELKHLSLTDKLTNLHNRAYIDQALEKELQRAKRFNHTFGIIILDIDYFKKVNDTYGHLYGDKVLIQIANILKYYSRESDFVGRWGGEEFMIICPETDINALTKVAENLRLKIETFEFEFSKKQSASFGLTINKQDDTVDTIVKRADEALYNAKANGRNRVEYI